MPSAAISCLLKLILVSGTVYTVASGNQLHDRQLQVLGEVVSGPARGRPLTLHLDAALPADVQQAVLEVEAVRRAPRLTMSLSLNHSHGQLSWHEAAAASLPRVASSSSSMLHVVLWFTPQPELLQALWHHCKPRNLLLLNMGSTLGAEVLRAESLSGVEKLVLIGHLLAEAEQDPDALGVYTVLPFSPGGVQLLGPWRRESFGSWEALFPDRFPSFEGYTFHLASWMIDYPYLYRKNKTSSQGRGITIKVVDSLSVLLNFSYTLTVEPPELVYAGKVNGSWAGTLGMVYRKEKNFTVNMFYVTLERWKDFDPSAYWSFIDIDVFLSAPQPFPMSTNLLRPFTFGVWATVVTSLAVAMSSCLVLEKTGGARGLARPSATSVWLQLHRGLVGQSVPALPRAPWQRVFLAVWLPCCLVITTAYTGNLVGILSSPAYPRRLHTLRDLADSDFRYGCNDLILNKTHY
ncbi:Glutamate receptor ionotropic, delta-1 [Chionoecetes opilio]|uniref:Glutamate receptor ionotropic, delta-1 n=1 Tax=Chionoecetes opilio TaxID=41210 RepID=A0A8J4XN65_CHIOP|nr:Glutamate receptor ionotropic, delta-1 [Chionoecetes opilio]